MSKLVQFTVLLAVAVAVNASYGQQAPLRQETQSAYAQAPAIQREERVSSYAQPTPVIVREVIKAEPILVPGPEGPMGPMGQAGQSLQFPNIHPLSKACSRC